jgi:beta-lactamase class A
MERKELVELIKKEVSEAQADISLMVEDLNSGEILFSCQEELQVVSASLIKVPIMITALEQVQKGSLNRDSLITVPDSIILKDTEVFEYGGGQYTLDELLVWMIISSDNTATNCLIDLLTKEEINRTLRELSLKNTKLERHMLDFEAVKQGYNNYTSAQDMGILFKALYHKTILTKELCDYALNILFRQRDKQNSMRYITEEVKAAHKTGGLDFLDHDAGIFYLKEAHYYFGAFVFHAPDDRYGKKWIGRVSKAVFEYYRQGPH